MLKRKNRKKHEMTVGIASFRKIQIISHTGSVRLAAKMIQDCFVDCGEWKINGELSSCFTSKVMSSIFYVILDKLN